MLEQNFNRTILFGCLFEITINKVGQQERTAHVVIAATYRNNTKILLLIQGIFNDGKLVPFNCSKCGRVIILFPFCGDL